MQCVISFRVYNLMSLDSCTPSNSSFEFYIGGQILKTSKPLTCNTQSSLKGVKHTCTTRREEPNPNLVFSIL